MCYGNSVSLRTVTDLLTGAWKMSDQEVNGTMALKKVDQQLWLWYTKVGQANGPCWCITDQPVQDSQAWPSTRCYGRIGDVNASPSGDIFIPYQSQTAANWVLSSAMVFVPQMAHSLLSKYEAHMVYANSLQRKHEELQAENKRLKEENEQLKLEIEQLHLPPNKALFFFWYLVV